MFNTVFSLACMALTLGAQPSASAVDKLSPKADTALTIYSSSTPGPGQTVGFAIVRHDRDIELGESRTTIRFTDVAARIDPTTVTFVSLTDPDGTHVLEQNYEFDLVSADKLMDRFLDRTITVEQVLGDDVRTFTGTLLSTLGGLVLQGEDGSVQVINGYSNIQFPELPGGLITKPTLVWDVAVEKLGRHRTRVMYETKAIGWWSDYNIEYVEGADANSGILNISAWVSIINQSGATYTDAKLKLVAGDVHRITTRSGYTEGVPGRMLMSNVDKGFEEKSLFEYHLYTLGRKTTLSDNSTKQIELFPTVQGVPCDKILVYNGQGGRFYGFGAAPNTNRGFGGGSNTQVETYLRFENSAVAGLGIPLPAGRIRVSQRDPADGSLEFIGEDAIDHTPKDEKVVIKMGTAFDVVGERKQVDFKVGTVRNWMEETIEIKIRNHKDKPVTVIVREGLYRCSNWSAICNYDWQKVNAHTMEIPVTVGKDAEVVIQYNVQYTW